MHSAPKFPQNAVDFDVYGEKVKGQYCDGHATAAETYRLGNEAARYSESLHY